MYEEGERQRSVLFRICKDGDLYSIPIQCITWVEPLVRRPTTVARSPDHIIGVYPLHGKNISIVRPLPTPFRPNLLRPKIQPHSTTYAKPSLVAVLSTNRKKEHVQLGHIPFSCDVQVLSYSLSVGNLLDVCCAGFL